MLTPKIEYSIIIPFYGDESYLHILLESIDNQLGNTEIIIVTNRSINLSENIKIIVTDGVASYPKSINTGANNAIGSYLIFCDADSFIMAGSLPKLVSCFHSNNNIGIASSKLVCPYTGRVLDFGIGFSRYNSPHIGRDRPASFPLLAENRSVQAACSANMMIERETFLDMNGFDEALSHSYSDLDLCLRLKAIHKEIWVAADSIVFHRGNSSNPNAGIYKNDVKGRFWALNADRINADMSTYFKQSYEFLKSEYQYTFKSYFLIDLSTVADYTWHYDVFTNDLHLRITDIYKFQVSGRDSSHIQLYGSLTWNILKLRYPIIFFVDRFVAIADNKLWWQLRNNEDDLVIDRNGNIDKISNIIDTNG